MKRTHLPLNALRVFDAAARHLSFTRAADELAVTPAAVGQQIRALEDMMGVVLFRRTPKGLELTDEASAGLEALRSGFLHFEDAVRAMQAGQSSHVYTIAAPRDFFAAWLAPRLAAFRAANPEVRYSLVSDESADFTEANLDLAVRWSEGPGELEGVALGDMGRVTVGAGEWIVAEADESDGSFHKLHAEVSIITNIDTDHLDHYKNCCFCGTRLYFTRRLSQAPGNQNASLDRIDSNKGYEVGNIQWSCWDCNHLKRDYIDGKFIEMCKKIADYQNS